jgi:hypothetical protein
MPMIDVYSAAGNVSGKNRLGQDPPERARSGD